MAKGRLGQKQKSRLPTSCQLLDNTALHASMSLYGTILEYQRQRKTCKSTFGLQSVVVAVN